MHYYTEQVLVYMCFLERERERERRVERAWCLLNASSNTQVSASTYYMNSVHSTLCYAAKIPYYFFLYFCRYNIFFFKIDFPFLLLSGVSILQYTFILHILYNYVPEKALEKKCSWSVTILAVVTHILESY